MILIKQLYLFIYNFSAANILIFQKIPKYLNKKSHNIENIMR